MKQKCWPFLICFFICSKACIVQAQMDYDTTFSFYYHTAEFKADSTQQKAFETFLKGVGNFRAIRGYTDTIGSSAFNYNLAQRRAEQVMQLLPKYYHNKNIIEVKGETNTFPLLWQNRRVDVLATKEVVIQGLPHFRKNRIKETLDIENILFLPDQPLLTEASYAYVQQLARQLQQYKSERFQVIGHVNYQSKLPADRLKDLYQLSEARAKTVYQLLIQYGIDADRMTYKGVGNSQPVIANPANDDEKRKNMRVQVLILH